MSKRFWQENGVLKRTTLIAVAIVAVGGAASVVADDYRWWVWRGEFIELADDSYLRGISLEYDKRATIRLHQDLCRERKNCSQQRLIELYKEENRLSQSIKKLETKHFKAVTR